MTAGTCLVNFNHIRVNKKKNSSAQEIIFFTSSQIAEITLKCGKDQDPKI